MPLKSSPSSPAGSAGGPLPPNAAEPHLDGLADRVRDAYRTFGLETSIVCLWEGLRGFLPISRITCVFKGYNETSMVLFAQVPAGSRPPGRVLMHDLLPPSVRRELFDVTASRFIAIDDLQTDPSPLAEKIRIVERTTERSLLLIPLLATGTYFFFLGFYSQESVAFGPWGDRILRLCKPLARAMRSFFAVSVRDPAPLPGEPPAINLLTMCPGLAKVTDMAQKVAATNATVLILGETGTGKEVVARAIHEQSARRSGPFVKVNCGAIPETLLDSELFGHERGAFTGAVQTKPGYFEQAHGGTILLDEIGELSPMAQVRLLRVLETGRVQRVGGTRSIAVDMRIIAATRCDLRRMVEEGSFREDLWYRLYLYPIHLPPLRRRVGDIPRLARHFFKLKSECLGLALPMPDVLTLANLLSRDWPGNVRQLEHLIERALILRQGEPSDAPLRLEEEENCLCWDPEGRLSQLFPAETFPTLDQLNAAYIRFVLNHTNGVIKGPHGAAALLGVHPSTLRHRMAALGIENARPSPPPDGQEQNTARRAAL